MLVSSLSVSKSRSFLLIPEEGDDLAVRVEATDSALEVRPLSAGVAERPRARLEDGRTVGGRIDVVVRFVTNPGRGRPDILDCMYMVGKEAGVAMAVVLMYHSLR